MKEEGDRQTERGPERQKRVALGSRDTIVRAMC